MEVQGAKPSARVIGVSPIQLSLPLLPQEKGPGDEVYADGRAQTAEMTADFFMELRIQDTSVLSHKLVAEMVALRYAEAASVLEVASCLSDGRFHPST